MKGSLLSGAVLGATLIASFSHAASFNVTIFNDPTPGPCDSSCSLREAVIAANGNGGTNDIQLGTGTYNLTIPEDGNATGGSLDINNDLTIQGQGADATIINAVQPALGGRVMEVDGGPHVIVLDGVTVQGGLNPGSLGAGLLVSGTSHTLTLSNCRFTNNRSGDGGGVFTNATTTIRNCRFDHNSLEGTAPLQGAGVHFDSALTVPLLVENSVFDNNEAPSGGQGSGLFFGGGASLTLTGSRFESNKLPDVGNGAALFCEGGPVSISDTIFTMNSIEGAAGAGGAIFCSPDSISLDGVTISDNSTDGGDYAGIFVSGGSLTSIQNSAISGNRITAAPGRYPGGLFTSGDVEILNSTIQDNVNEGDGNGGGLWITGIMSVEGSTFSGNRTNGNAAALDLEAGEGHIVNSTFTDNEAGGDGGAIRINTGNGSFNNLTISGNIAQGEGGGVFFTSFGTFTLHNTILAGNEAIGSGDDCRSDDSVSSAGYNLIGTGEGCLIDPPAGASTDIYGADPLLQSLADNGGPTPTLALAAGSPAIDAGDPAGCTDEDGDPLTIDQRGAPRPFGDRCDIGAFEFGSAPSDTSNLSILKSVDHAQVPLQAPVTFTLNVQNEGPAANTNVVAVDSLPAGFALVSASADQADCVTSGNDVTCTAASLAAGEGFTVTIVADAVQAGDWVNTARVSGDVAEFDPADDESSVNILVEDQGPILGGGGCRLGGEASSSSLAMAWLAGLAGAWRLRRRRS